MAEPDTERGETVSKPAPPAKKRPPSKRAATPPRKNGNNGKAAKAAPAHPGHGWIWVALVAVAILSGGGIATVWLMEAATQQADAARIEAQLRADLAGAVAKAADERLAGLTAQLEQMEERMAAVPDRASAKETEAAMALLAEKIDGLAGRIGDLENGRAAAPETGVSDAAVAAAAAEAKRNAEELAALKERLANLEAAREVEAPVEAERKQTLVVAVGQLREALTVSKPFAAELEAVTALGGDEVRGMTAAIAPFAASGIPTLTELREQFQAVAGKIAAAGEGPEEGDWFDKALSQAASVVRVRKVGPVEGSDAAAIVSRAEDQLGSGNLQNAVDELAALTGAAAEAAQDWMTQARARLDSEQALRDLHNHVIGQIAQSPGPSP